MIVLMIIMIMLIMIIIIIIHIWTDNAAGLRSASLSGSYIRISL